MTQTLEQIMHNNPFELVDSPWGRMESWRASTMACGTMGALAQVYEIVRNDAAELQEKTVAFDAKKASVLRTVNKLLHFVSRVDALNSRVDALEARRRSDEQAQREFEEPIELPRDILEHQTLSHPQKIEDTTPPGPTGELHSLPPSEAPEPSLEVEDEVGDLPEELADPPEPVPEPKGSVYPQPTAISLNKE